MLLCPSMMCADLSRLGEEVKDLEQAGIDIFHCDIMDGSFVPNMALGLEDVKTIKGKASKPIDVHLMIEHPADKVDWFLDAGADIIYIHPESERYVSKTLNHIKDRGASAGIAINPDTSIETIQEILPVCDYVMVMTVNPGFAGQKFVTFTKEKIKKLAALKKTIPFKLMIDGHCSPDVIKELSALGADGFILGTSALFGKGKSYQELISDLRGM